MQARKPLSKIHTGGLCNVFDILRRPVRIIKSIVIVQSFSLWRSAGPRNHAQNLSKVSRDSAH